MTKILDGKIVAKTILEKVTAEISELNFKPCLVAVQVGSDAASLRYIKNQLKYAEEVGARAFHKQFPDDITEQSFANEFKHIINDPDITAVILMTPLPKGWDKAHYIEMIPPEKDIEGVTPANLGKMYLGEKYIPLPCTANATVTLLEHYGRKDLAGLNCTVVGRSANVGLAAVLLMQQRNATVTNCHSKTANNDFDRALLNADIVITAAGKAGIIDPSKLKPTAWLIDVGTNFVDGKLVGDAMPTADGKIDAYTPVPGGVGAITVALLMQNLLTLAKRRVLLPK